MAPGAAWGEERSLHVDAEDGRGWAQPRSATGTLGERGDPACRVNHARHIAAHQGWLIGGTPARTSLVPTSISGSESDASRSTPA